LNDLLADPALQTRMDQIDARDRTIPVVAAAIATRTAAALAEAFETLGIPYSPIAKPSDMYSDPHVMRPGGLVTSHLPDGQSFRAPSLPVDVDGVMMNAAGDVPALGADTAAVLSELGLDAEAIGKASGTARKAA
jgi:crotonobetainyl-CoA:carnitine CoA-transferase CaiB-like acyl-CoA transferase